MWSDFDGFNLVQIICCNIYNILFLYGMDGEVEEGDIWDEKFLKQFERKCGQLVCRNEKLMNLLCKSLKLKCIVSNLIKF